MTKEINNEIKTNEIEQPENLNHEGHKNHVLTEILSTGLVAVLNLFLIF